MRIFTALLDFLLVDSYVIWRTMYPPHHPRHMSHSDFNWNVHKTFCSPDSIIQRDCRIQLDEAVECSFEERLHKSGHIPVKLVEDKSSGKRFVAYQCGACSRKGHRDRRTVWGCKLCKVPLHFGGGNNCFEEYHRNVPDIWKKYSGRFKSRKRASKGSKTVVISSRRKAKRAKK